MAVVKVGGSLLHLPNVGAKLRSWIDRYPVISDAFGFERRVLLIVGGGGNADFIRQMEKLHQLHSTACHWLAIRAMTLNSHLVASLTERTEVISRFDDAACTWRKGWTPILDPFDFLIQDESKFGALPHSWDVSSDSIAARCAIVHQANELVLLKSRPPPTDGSWERAAAEGFVDKRFPRLASLIPTVKVVDFRSYC